MSVERGARIIHIEAVGGAYLIAADYLRRSGVSLDTRATHQRLLEIIVGMFRRGDDNEIRIANKAIALFEAKRRA